MLPKSLLTAVVICCYTGISLTHVEAFQLLPRFVFTPFFRRTTVLINYPDDYVEPGKETMLIQLYKTKRLSFKAKIINVPQNEKMELRIKYKCNTQPGPEREIIVSPPFDVSLKENRLCGYNNQIDVGYLETGSGAFSPKIENGTYHIGLYTHKEGGGFAYDDALTEYGTFRVAYVGSNWRLDSNPLFMQSWNPLTEMEWHGHAYYHQFFLTNDSLDLLTKPQFTDYNLFETRQFIRKEFIEQLNKGSEFVRETVYIGAVIAKIKKSEEVDIHIESSRSENFGTKRLQTKTYYMDSKTGKITFSCYGLSNFLYHNIVFHGRVHSTNYTMTIRASMSKQNELLLLREMEPLDIRESNIEEPRDRMKPNEPKDHCKIVENHSYSNVTFFPRTGSIELVLQCPIVCSHELTKFTFSRLDGVKLIRRSSVIKVGGSNYLKFNDKMTHEDSAEYKCTAQDKQAIIRVKVVALPAFSIYETEYSGGELPYNVYVVSGVNYSVSCSVYYSSMNSVTLTPVFFVWKEKPNKFWTKLDSKSFIDQMKKVNSIVTVSYKNTSFSTTMTLDVTSVPVATEDFPLNHRIACEASVSEQDAAVFGIPEYTTQSTSDVFVVEVPKPDDILLELGPCCQSDCPAGNQCSISFILKPEIVNRLTYIGIELRGSLTDSDGKLDDEAQKHTTFTKSDHNRAAVTYNVSKKFADWTKQERDALYRLTPVFDFFGPNQDGLSKAFRNGAADWSCVQSVPDYVCITSTTSVPSLMTALNIGTKFGDMLGPVVNETKRALLLQYVHNQGSRCQPANWISLFWYLIWNLVLGTVQILA